MSKITNDGLTRSDTGCFKAVPNSGLKGLKLRLISFLTYLLTYVSTRVKKWSEGDDVGRGRHVTTTPVLVSQV